MHLEYVFTPETEEQKQILIALLSDIGFSGFLETEGDLKAYVSSSDRSEDALATVLNIVDVRHTVTEIEERNWNAEWESGFEAIEVFEPDHETPFARIRANFHDADHRFKHDLVITPKMSFGTGHHPTTYLMVSEMSQIDFTGKAVIDFGTGTGVLAILAEKSGATDVKAVDCDDWSINNAKENLSANRCSHTAIIKGETIPAGYKADIILANINTNIIINNIQGIAEACAPNATVLLSGVMAHDRERLSAAVINAGFDIIRVRSKSAWLLLLCRCR